RPTSEKIAAKYAQQFPDVKLFTIEDVAGGWDKVQKAHFGDGGIFDQIYVPGRCTMFSAAAIPAMRSSPFRVIPGFNITLGFTLVYLCLIVLIPLSAVFLKTFTMSWSGFWEAVTSDRVMASYRLSFGASLIAAAINVVFGGIVARSEERRVGKESRSRWW